MQPPLFLPSRKAKVSEETQAHLDAFQQQTQRLLTQVHQALDHLHTFCIPQDWVHSHIGKNVHTLLQSLEEVLLLAWSRSSQKQYGTLASELSAWHCAQLRNHEGWVSLYYQHVHLLQRWESNLEESQRDCAQGWEGFLMFQILFKSTFAVSASHESIASEPKHWGLLAERYLQQMQHLRNLDPYTLCLDISDWLLPFIAEEPFLPQLLPVSSSTNSSASTATSPSETPLTTCIQHLKDASDWGLLADWLIDQEMTGFL